MRVLGLLCLLSFLLLVPFFAYAQPRAAETDLPLRVNTRAEHDRYRYRARFVSDSPRVDGDLSDPVWQEAAVIEEFTQQEPHFGQPATEKTEVRVVYDSTALYFGIYSHDSDPSGVVRNILRFRYDSVWSQDDVVRIVLDTFHDHRRGYVFSFNALGTKQDAQIDNQVWNSNWDEVWEVRTQWQEDGWTAEISIPFRILRFPVDGDGIWGFNIFRSVKRRNEVSFWAPIPPGTSMTRNEFHGHLEGLSGIQPGRNLQVIPYGLMRATRSTGRSANTNGDVGGDLKYSLTSALSLDLTYNTNFAQVEADDQQINLTRFSLFFPEKREFFLENSQLFSFGLDREAQIFFSRRIGLVDREPVPILGGVRLSGRVGDFDIGLLTTQTDSHLKAPSTNLSAVRARWNVGRRSYVGGIFTSVFSDQQGNRVFGPDARIWLGQNLYWEGFWTAVDDWTIPGHPMSYTTALLYDQDLWGLTLRTLSIDEQFEPALGFVQREDLRQHTASLRRSFRLNRSWARKLNFSGQFGYLTDQQGVLETRDWGFEASSELDSGDLIRLKWGRTYERLRVEDDPFLINPREGIVIPPGPYNFDRWEIEYVGFEGRSWVPKAKIERGDFYGGRRTGLNFSAVWRASPHLLLETNYELNDIALPQGAFSTHLWRGRVSIPLTARMTTDAFLQWNSLTDELNTQLRFHLIYARDSNFFVVFTDQRQDRGTGRIERDQAVQVKLTCRLYW